MVLGTGLSQDPRKRLWKAVLGEGGKRWCHRHRGRVAGCADTPTEVFSDRRLCRRPHCWNPQRDLRRLRNASLTQTIIIFKVEKKKMPLNIIQSRRLFHLRFWLDCARPWAFTSEREVTGWVTRSNADLFKGKLCFLPLNRCLWFYAKPGTNTRKKTKTRPSWFLKIEYSSQNIESPIA